MEGFSEKYSEGKIDECISQLVEEIKQYPDQHFKRMLFGQMLCVAGEYERADKQLDLLSTLEPKYVMEVANWRNLIRAAQHREDFYKQGRPPKVIGEPSPQMEKHIEAIAALRADDSKGFADALHAAEEGRQAVKGSWNEEDKRFDDFRDLDDLNGGFMEVLAPNGNYYWIANESISSIVFEDTKQPIDYLWRKADLILNDGTQGEVYIPVTYIDAATDQQRLARETDWQECDVTETVRGMGQKTYLVGDEAVSILEINSLEFQQ
ncbi:type VI secretion system accessory protein TagJ [Kangiella shandongensis]|uniref:type VI secretion system accessory protein TagJ n=1 Tax=Kangiella shandongensis TaxID=2763258 RepID=UPI001CBD4492|nr:type VI secretion system accessory protein TagJ [Kangiella shandongensis]